jgi:hypothetical protein
VIYVASSWRNPHYGGVLDALEQWNIKYYDWRDEEGFHWSDVFGVMELPMTAAEVTHRKVEHWTEPIPVWVFDQALQHPLAEAGFQRDLQNLYVAEALIMLLPCGKSAHLEAGFAAALKKPTAIYAKEPIQPELMYGMFGEIFEDITELMGWASLHTTERIIGPDVVRASSS